MICVNSISVYPGSVTLQVGAWYYGASATVYPSGATCKEVTWRSNNTNVATVNASSGYIYAKNAGTARIYATATDGSGASDYLIVTVSNTIMVNSISLSDSCLYLEEEECYSLSATVYPSNATNPSLTWCSSNMSVATVEGGRLRAVGKGTAEITVSANDGSGVWASCYVTVTGDILVSSVTLDKSYVSLMRSHSACLYATVCPTNATNQNVKWSSSNTDVATVNPDSGMIYAKRVGTTVICATAQDGSGHYDSCQVAVRPLLVDTIELLNEEVTIHQGYTYTMGARVWPDNADNRTVCWCSDNPCVASVDPCTGVVTAHAVGTTSICASAVDGGGACSCCTVTVWPTVAVESVHVYPENKDMNVGEIAYFAATVLPIDATDISIRWSSSDSNVATVGLYGGRVEAKSSGTCSITATTVDGGFTASCRVTVKPVLTYPDTLIEDSNTRSKILKIKIMLDENEKAYMSGKISLDTKELIESQLQKECDIIRADYIAVENNPTSNYAYAILGGDKTAVISSSFSNVLTLNSQGLAVIVVQRALEVMGYYEPEPDETYGTFDANTYNAAASYPCLLSYNNETKQYVFDNSSFNVLFQNSTLAERTYAAFTQLNSFRAAHNTVAIWSAAKVGGTYKMSDNKIKNGNITGTYYGYADVLKNTGTGTYIWEVKPDEFRYYQFNGLGARQLQRYINAGNAYDQAFNKPVVAGYKLGTFSIPYINGKYIDVRGGEEAKTVDDIRSGLVLYNVRDTPKYALETNAVEVEEPSVSYDYAEAYTMDTETLGTVIIIGVIVVLGIVCVCMLSGAVAGAGAVAAISKIAPLTAALI